MLKRTGKAMTKVLLILFCLTGLSLYADLLTKTPYIGGEAKKLVFKNSSQGIASCYGPGCKCKVEFSYVVEGSDKVRVTKVKRPKDQESDYCPIPLLETPCTLRIDSNEKIYNNEIVCGEEIYTNVAPSIAKNTQTEIDSVPVIFLDKAAGSTTTAVKFRQAPDATAQAGKCFSDGGPPINVLEKNTGVSVFARTLEKVKVGNWNNYWYFVDAGPHCSFGEDQQKSLPYGGVWVFGEFIKLKK